MKSLDNYVSEKSNSLGEAKINGTYSLGTLADQSSGIAVSSGLVDSDYLLRANNTYSPFNDVNYTELNELKNNVFKDLPRLTVGYGGFQYLIPSLNEGDMSERNSIRAGYYSWMEAVSLTNTNTSSLSTSTPPGFMVWEFDETTEWDVTKYSLTQTGIAKFMYAGAKGRFVYTLEESIADIAGIRRNYEILERKFQKVKAAKFKIAAGTI